MGKQVIARHLTARQNKDQALRHLRPLLRCPHLPPHPLLRPQHNLLLLRPRHNLLLRRPRHDLLPLPHQCLRHAATRRILLLRLPRKLAFRSSTGALLQSVGGHGRSILAAAGAPSLRRSLFSVQLTAGRPGWLMQACTTGRERARDSGAKPLPTTVILGMARQTSGATICW